MRNQIQIAALIDGLNELSNRERQEQLWLSDGSSGEVSSFTEAICGVFDDSGVTRGIESGAISGSTAALFNELKALISKIPEDVPPEETINNPLMIEVRRVSLELLNHLRESK
jgi:hypothetical protein